jgi:glycosyltransferase involved in cell wall biosynthesis
MAATSIAFLSLFVICIILVIYPFTFYPGSLKLLSRHLPPAGSEPHQSASLRFSFVCCAYNERNVIEAKISNLMEAAQALGSEAELLVYDDGSNDGTAEMVARHPGIRLFGNGQRHGKTYGINLLASQAKGDILIFSDANVSIDTADIGALPGLFADPTVGLISGTIEYVNPEASQSAKVSSLYQSFEEQLKKLETATGSTVYTDGTLFALRSKLFRPVPPQLTDDFFIALNVLAQGHRVIASSVLRAKEKASVDARHDNRRRMRIGCNSFACHLGMREEIARFSLLNRYKYTAHKLLRWFCAHFILIGVIAFFASAASLGYLLEVTQFAIVAAIMLVALAAAGFAPVLAIIRMLTVIFAVGIGVSMALFGYRYITWASPASAR